MKRVLIVGDSFMKPDVDYPGQHFSEMLGSVETIVLSTDGSSMGMILDQIIRGLDHKPDGVIIGFTAADRVEYLRHDGYGGPWLPGHLPGKWVPSGAIGAMTAEQKEFDLFWRTQNDCYMSDIKGHAMASGIMTMLDHLSIPFAWTTNLLFSNSLDPHYWILESMLVPFAHRCTATKFTQYGKFVDAPGFHVDDPEWQQKFAKECLEILALQG